jgi:hypothetical protein
MYPGGGDGAAPPTGGIHSGCRSSVRGRSKPSPTRSSRSLAVNVEKRPWVARRDDGHPVGHHRAEGVAAQGTGRAVSSSLAKSLGLRKPKREAGSGAKNHRQTLSRVYKDQGETSSTFRPDRTRDSKTQSETAVPRTARARATAAPRNTRPVALTPRRDRRRLWQEKRTTLRLRHNDRDKKGTPRRSISYPFPFFLFLSLATGTGKGGYPEKDPSP